jgi:threonine dehydrogenase-like Zn-dependent dehydrogenase
MFQPVADVARDTPAGPGWSAVLDLGRCPDAWLPWLAQFVGVTVIAGSTPNAMRERIASTDGFKRGTPEAIRGAAQATLTGNRTVTFRERDANSPDPPYTLEVVTLTGETPNPAATRAAIVAQKPGGIVLNYRTVEGQDWQAVQAKTWRQARTTYASWRNLRDNA